MRGQWRARGLSVLTGQALCEQVKERLKKTRQDKAVLKATDAKKGGGKAPKSALSRAPAKGARR